MQAGRRRLHPGPPAHADVHLYRRLDLRLSGDPAAGDGNGEQQRGERQARHLR
jgi:hypothetical protein